MTRNTIGTPHVVTLDQDGEKSSARKIHRQALDTGRSEDWLQQLLHEHPELLPVNLVDERVQEPLVPLAREVTTAAGYIDNLLISPNGYPVIVETKLWRNPEARRKVVAQLLDYAAQARTWSYNELESIWQKDPVNTESLWSFVKPPDYDNESDWIDLVSENLRLGRFSLLIVGDGIRTEARQLGEVVSGHPDFQFRLGFVELRLYELSESQTLVLPSCIARTVEIERAVIRFELAEGMARVVSVQTPAETDTPTQTKSSVLNEQAFLDELKRHTKQSKASVRTVKVLLGLLKDSDLTLDWQTASVSMKYPDPNGSGTMLSLGTIYKNGSVGCWTSVLAPQLNKTISDPKLAQQILDSHTSRGRSLGMTGKKDIGIDAAELMGKEQAIADWLEETITMIRKQADQENQLSG